MKKNKLKKLITKIFINHNLNKDHAIICANAIVNAELVGAPSHGLSRLKMYCDRINKKLINPKPKIKIKKISQSITHIDAKNSIGFVAADIGIKEAIKNNSKVFVLEGDAPEHVMVNYIILIIQKTRIGLIQWGSYIYTKLTSVQSYLPYDTFVVKSLSYKSIINRAKTHSKIKKFS